MTDTHDDATDTHDDTIDSRTDDSPPTDAHDDATDAGDSAPTDPRADATEAPPAALDPVRVETAIRDGPARLDDPDGAVAAFRAGYRERRPVGGTLALRRAVYRLVCALRPLRTFDSWGPAVVEGTDRTVAGAAASVRERVRDRIDAVEEVA